MPEPERSRAARAASEAALVRVVHHYGGRPEFVVLGGLVPELLCAGSAWRHAGTTDVDVQVDLEVACGAINTARLENALRNAEFEPDTERVWRWVADGARTKTIVKFELLADLDDQPNEAIVRAWRSSTAWAWSSAVAWMVVWSRARLMATWPSSRPPPAARTWARS